MLHRAWQRRGLTSAEGPTAARRSFVSTRERAIRRLGFCGWVLAGGTALCGVWELGNFEQVLGHNPVGAPMHQPAAPAIYRPAGEGGSGCTQAPIDRVSGQTTPVDCHTMAPASRVVGRA